MTQPAPSLKIRLAIFGLIRDNLDDLLHTDNLNSFRSLIDAAQVTTYPQVGSAIGYLAQQPSEPQTGEAAAQQTDKAKSSTKKSTAETASSAPGATQEKPAPKGAAPAADGDKEPSAEEKQKMPEYVAIKTLILELSKTDRPKAAEIIAPAAKLVDVPVSRFPEVTKALEVALGKVPAEAADLA